MYKNALKEKDRIIRYLLWINGGLFALVMMVATGWMLVQRDITLHYPPDLRQGAVMKVDEIPPTEVYAFASYVFTYLNTWNEDGEADYPANRYRLRAFLTPRFQRWILDNIKDLKQTGEISGRVRTIQPLPGSVYDPEDVTILSNGSWRVWLDFRIKEYLNGTPIKDVVIRYPVRIVVYKVPPEANPWQLAIDGFEEPGPQRIPHIKGELD